MISKEAIKEAVENLRRKINDKAYKNRSKCTTKAFTRASKLGFVKTILLKLNFAKRSGAVEVYKFFREVAVEEPVSRQAYEKSRNQISHTAFSELFDDSVKIALSVEDAKLHKGYRILPIDGTTLRLDKSESLKERFGKSTPHKGEVYARISICTDILNGTILDGSIEGFNVGERRMAIRHIEKDLCENALYLADRGYYSFEIVDKIISSGRKFLIRLASNSIAELARSEQDSGFVEVRHKSKAYKLRYYKFQLKSGEMEYLLTNLDEAEFSDEDLKELYAMRWGIETKYNEMKNQMLLESFTGKSELVVMQDFYATLYMMNLVAFSIMAAESEIPEKERKYEYKINKNTTIGMLKNNLIRTVTEEDPKRSNAMIDKLMKDISRCIVPIRPGRYNKRKKTDMKRRKKIGLKSAF